MTGSAPDGGHDPLTVFLAHLEVLPLDAWIAATMRRGEVAHMADAEVALLEIVRELPDQRAVFAARDGVLYALQRFQSADGRRLARSRQAVQHLRPATEHAALSVVARPHLSTHQFATLYAPFELLIPPASVFGSSNQ